MGMFGSLRYLAMMSSNLNGGGTGTGTGGAPSDWNAKEGEAGHVLNRTHYSEIGFATIWDMQLTEETGPNITARPSVPIMADETYSVSWNGVEYECVGQPYSMEGLSVVVLGDGSQLGLSGNNEPFLILCVDLATGDSMGMYGAVDTVEELPISLKVSGRSEIVHKLDEKYIPIPKTHWVTEEDIVLLPETTYTTENALDGIFPVASSMTLEAGISYKVIWNGEEYNCVATTITVGSGEQTVGLGDAAWFNLDSEGDYPFGFMKNTTENMQYIPSPFLLFSNETLTEVTISIIEPAGTVHKIDPKFIPGDTGSMFISGIAQGSIRGRYTVKEDDTYQLGKNAIAFGLDTKAKGTTSFANGWRTAANGDYSYTEGVDTLAEGAYSHAEGCGYEKVETLTITGDKDNVIFTYSNDAFIPEAGNVIGIKGNYDNYTYRLITSVDTKNKILTTDEPIYGHNTSSGLEVIYRINIANGNASHSEGSNTIAFAQNSHAEGCHTSAGGCESHAEGKYTFAMGDFSHAEGYETETSDMYAHSEGLRTKASGSASHSEGIDCLASGAYSHAEGHVTIASGFCSHSQGRGCIANTAYLSVSGKYNAHETKDIYIVETKHIEDQDLNANLYLLTGTPSFDNKTGVFTFETKTNIERENIKVGDLIYEHDTASNNYSKLVREYFEIIKFVEINEYDSYVFEVNRHSAIDTRREPGEYLTMVGNGTGSTSRSNAYTLDWNGNGWFAGTVEGTGVIVKSTTLGSTKRFMITVDDTGAIKATEVTE